MKKLYHFLGGITFAIILIGTTTVVVIAGTFLESYADSHRFAALFTYSSPAFTLLLSLFFVNILFSSLRRWPFTRRHIPFLITHLGLLLLLSGAIGKQLFGTQGTMRLVEGSGSQQLLIADSYAIEITSPTDKIFWPITPQANCQFGDLHLSCQKWRENSREHLEFWIKGPWTYVNGLPPFPVAKWQVSEPLTPTITARTETNELWNFAAYRTNDIEALMKASEEAPHPLLLFVEDEFGDNHLLAYDSQGHFNSEIFRRNAMESLIAYENGYQGYAIESKLIPALECPITRRHVVQATCKKLEDNLPLVVLKANGEEDIPLTYDKSGSGIRWPILDGAYLLRFQPMCYEIPYHVRLHQAKQINYPNGSQPFSYEANITVTSLTSGEAVETLLSMNKVYETWDGYRFYLSNIAPGTEAALHQVQIVVNHDPVKYWLTYPGAIFMCFGIVLLLFWKEP